MAEFEERRFRGLSWTSILAPSAEKRISEAVILASNYHVLRSDEVEFETYSQVIHPIPDKMEWSKTSEGPVDEGSIVVRPPMFRPPPGRPENKRLCIEDINR
ncbi:hypothetical protein GIB67_036110 [Kingdonia uniflora]|uniref:Uncharacterized protein n=1 Tax=Kingdonia uniflora TaxID=39325 RepID=A0A7J7N9I1_9MAGN|nr:hypothetical protein GIB67_036110 [Kingdonia uniflora]